MRLGQLTSAAVVTIAFMAPVLADTKSGPSVGSPTGAFHVQDITGMHKGTALCYV